MNILITGATSFLGAAVSRSLLERGHVLYAPVRPQSARTGFLPVHPDFRIVPGDMNEITELDRSLPEFEACIHFAWAGVGVKGRMDPKIQEKNLRNTLELLKIAKHHGADRFLFAGSQAEYGVTSERIADGSMRDAPVPETQLCRPISEYGKTKLRVLKEGSLLAARLGIEYRHMRIFSVYGAGDHETSLLSLCIDNALRGSSMTFGPCRQKWNFLYINDCAEYIARLLELPAVAGAHTAEPDEAAGRDCSYGVQEAPEAACVYNIGSSDTRCLRSFAEEVFRTAGSGSAVFEERPQGPEGTPWLDPDITKLKSTVGALRETAFADGIREILALRTERSIL